MIPRLEEISGFIRNRRTIKPEMMDSTRDVPRPLLEKLFENANWAPSHGRTEPWRFSVYRGASRRRLGLMLQDLYQNETPADKFRPDKFEKLATGVERVPVVVVIFMHRQESEVIPEVEEIEAVACAMQNFHLSVSAAGLAGKWSSPPCLYSNAARRAFGLGKKDRCLGLFYLGWPADEIIFPEGTRDPSADKVNWIT